MLIGEYKHTLDQKKRVSLPARLRKEMGDEVVITHGLDGSLFIYKVSEWEKVAEKLGGLSMGQADSRGFNRFMLAGATLVELDSVGRMLIPDFLKDFAGLKEKVVIIGVHSRLEIWDEDRWTAYKSKVTGEADKLAEKLGEVGAI
ncbi:MAG: division/cell wall cluster transcriptional repressor MraZ [Candidatus Vogelbacteria bacterium]|nr:division/cell wall cluster transcriptional repressor MraZ [Candidatus Vogelbacteria bacterium]